MILEEFGKWINATVNATMAERDRYFSIVFNESNQLITDGSSLKVRTCDDAFSSVRILPLQLREFKRRMELLCVKEQVAANVKW